MPVRAVLPPASAKLAFAEYGPWRLSLLAIRQWPVKTGKFFPKVPQLLADTSSRRQVFAALTVVRQKCASLAAQSVFQ